MWLNASHTHKRTISEAMLYFQFEPLDLIHHEEKYCTKLISMQNRSRKLLVYKRPVRTSYISCRNAYIKSTDYSKYLHNWIGEIARPSSKRNTKRNISHMIPYNAEIKCEVDLSLCQLSQHRFGTSFNCSLSKIFSIFKASQAEICGVAIQFHEPRSKKNDWRGNF